MALKLDDYFEETDNSSDQENTEQETPDEGKPTTDEEEKPTPDDDYEKDFITPTSRKLRRRLIKWAAIVVAVLAVVMTIRTMFFAPAVSEGSVRGYVVLLEKADGFFNSYEGKFVIDIPEADSLKWFSFSTTDQALGKSIFNKMKTDSVLVCKYKKYNNTLPWRGKSTVIFEEIEAVSPTPISTKPNGKH